MHKLLGFFQDLNDRHPSAMGRTYALMAALCNASMAIFMKFVNKNVHFLTLLPVQSTLTNIICMMIFIPLGYTIYHPANDISLALLLRGVLGAGVFCLFTYGMKVLSPQKLIVLVNTMPIWVVILAPYFLGEYPNKMIVSMLAISFLGMIIMVYPGLILPSFLLEKQSETSSQEASQEPIYLLLIPIAGALVAASVNIFLKKYAKSITVFHNAGYLLIFLSFFSGLLASGIEKGEPNVTPSVKDCVFISFVGLCQVGFQIFLGLAARLEKRASLVSLLMNCQILFGYTMDYLILGNRIKLLNVVGGLLIIIASTVIAFSKEDEQNPPPPPADQIEILQSKNKSSVH